MFRVKSFSGCNCSPLQLQFTFPSLRNCATTGPIVADGIANPTSPPSDTPRVLIPITSPSVFTSGPPEFPGEIDASVCSQIEYWLDVGRYRRVHEMIPSDTLRDSPHGAPMAITKSPSSSFSESPSRAKGNFLSAVAAGALAGLSA